MKKQLYILLFILFCPALSWAACGGSPVGSSPGTITSYDCSVACVQDAIDAATADDDIVKIKSGTCTWASHVLIDNKKIHLRGENDCTLGSVGSPAVNNIPTSCGTNINLDLTSDRMLYINDATKSFELSHFNIISNGSVNSAWPLYGIIHIAKDTNKNAVTKGWRIHHLKFTFDVPADGSGGSAINVNGYQAGDIDHINYNLAYRETMHGVSNFVTVYYAENEPGGGPTLIPGGNAWSRAVPFGTDDAVYVEDSYIYMGNYGDVMDSQSGGSYVLRHNTIVGFIPETHSTYSIGDRAGRSGEIYSNDITTRTAAIPCIKWRAGTALLYNNTFNTCTVGIQFDDQRTEDSSGAYGRCDGNSAYDGNTTGQQGYPCMDQIGRGSGAPTAQTANPVFIWGNTSNTPSLYGTATNPSVSDHIKINRDWCEHDTSTSCGGVSVSYTPYPYPHPLQGAVTHIPFVVTP